MNVLSHRSNRKVYIDFLRSNGIEHSITYTNRTFKVVSRFGTRVFMSGEISKRGLGFMQKVFNFVKKNVADLQHLNKDYEQLGLTRMLFNRNVKPGKYIGMIELDIDKAYWNAAHKLNIINDELHETGLKNGYTKVELLACLGGLAKDKRIRYWDGTRYSKGVQVYDSSETKFLWDAISFEIDEAIKSCAKKLGNSFFFYWTDAIFLQKTKQNISIVEKTLKEHGFTCKQVQIEYIVYNPDQRQVLAFSKENKSHAKEPLRDSQGNFGRIFTMVTGQDKARLIQRIKSLNRQETIIKSVADLFQ